jgi:hypothetical protein
MSDIELLKGAIEKWDNIVQGKWGEWVYSECPLCDVYLIDEDCTSCPIKKKTGQDLCYGTPYRQYALGGQDWYRMLDEVEREKYLQFAEDELQFLKDLLEELENNVS